MGLLKNMRKRIGTTKPRGIDQPPGSVRRCPDCNETLEVAYIAGTGNGEAVVGMMCASCGDLFEEPTTWGKLGS